MTNLNNNRKVAATAEKDGVKFGVQFLTNDSIAHVRSPDLQDDKDLMKVELTPVRFSTLPLLAAFRGAFQVMYKEKGKKAEMRKQTLICVKSGNNSALILENLDGDMPKDAKFRISASKKVIPVKINISTEELDIQFTSSLAGVAGLSMKNIVFRVDYGDTGHTYNDTLGEAMDFRPGKSVLPSFEPFSIVAVIKNTKDPENLPTEVRIMTSTGRSDEGTMGWKTVAPFTRCGSAPLLAVAIAKALKLGQDIADVAS